MRVLSVNVSRVGTLLWRGRAISTSIDKRPVQGRVGVTHLRLEGDTQANLQVHGGINKAVYAYPIEHYAVWAGELGRSIAAPGAYGENLTVEGLLETELCLGDRLRIGTALLEVSEPREPCFKLDAFVQLDGFGLRMIATRRCGFYLRVIEEGTLQAGDPIAIAHRDPARVTIAEIFPMMINRRQHDPEIARRALEIPSLSPRLQRRMQQALAGNGEHDEDED